MSTSKNNETTYGQTIYLIDGRLHVEGCESFKAATERAVMFARSSGHKPPRWWQFSIPKWPAHCVDEYNRQEGV